MRLSRYIVVAAFGSVLVPPVAAQTRVGMRDAPPTQPDTIVCRGGPSLTWGDVVEWFGETRKRLIFQATDGPAGPQGLGLKPSQCGLRDKDYPQGERFVPREIRFRAATFTFNAAPGANAPSNRPMTIEEYLGDVNHFWSFTVTRPLYLSTQPYWFAEKHQRLDVPLLTDAGGSTGNVLTAKSTQIAPKGASAGQAGAAAGAGQQTPGAATTATTAQASAAATRAEGTPMTPIQSGGAVPSAARDKAQPPAKPFSVPPQAGGAGSQTPGETAGPDARLPPKDTSIQAGQKVLPNPVDKVGLNPQPPKDTPIAGEKTLPAPVERGVTPATERMTPAQVDSGLDPVPVGQAVVKPAEKVDIGVRTSSATVSPGDRIAGSSAATVERAGSIAPNLRIAADPRSVEIRINAKPDAQMAVLLFDHPPRYVNGVRGYPGPPLGAGQGERTADSNELVFSSQSLGLRLEPGKRYYYVITVTPGGGVHHGDFDTPPANVAPAAAIAGSATVPANTEAIAPLQPLTFSLPRRKPPVDPSTGATPISASESSTPGGPLKPGQGALQMDCTTNWPRISHIQGRVTPGAQFTINGSCFGEEMGYVEIIGQFERGNLKPALAPDGWRESAIVVVMPALSGVPDHTIAISVRRAADRKQSVAKQGRFVASRDEGIEVPLDLWEPNAHFAPPDHHEDSGLRLFGRPFFGYPGASETTFRLAINPLCALTDLDAPATVGRVHEIRGWESGPAHQANLQVVWLPRCTTTGTGSALLGSRETACSIAFTLKARASCPKGFGVHPSGR